ncbi:FERM domain-containing protein 5-like isoform X3 [Gigantopelta aegis]|uniref:FERM domain-containing protein 5-like isoform X3 n=1 Tax=Gigantopelta aegis TaxID=1735272 RepID=UPI001B887EC0|nr:FERM domain-containing protein 5-like isoform X3 [Gigantopelta aegis]
MFRKRSTKSDLQTEYTCSIRFLDDSEPIQLSFKKDTIGQWLFDRVCEKLNLVEKDYFGLRFVDSEKQRHWLDPLKTVYKQMKGVNPMVLCFRVKFYPEDPMKLHEEITRYYLFLQLRRDLHHGRLLCSPSDAIVMAADIIQSEVGDYEPEEHPPGYIAEFKMLPKQTPKMEEQMHEIHKTMKGQVPADAEADFLKKAAAMETYGVDPHQVKDQRGDQLYLGVTYQGIMTFRGSRRTQLFKWNQIRRIAYEGKMFIVHVNISEDEDTPPKKRKKEKKQQPIGYKCSTVAACKYLWRCAVEQQLFFTLSTSLNAPKIRSGGSLLSRGSKFRFSGRCQMEAYSASENIKRTNSLPSVVRKHHSHDPNESKTSTLNMSVMSEPLPEARRPYNVYLARNRGEEPEVNLKQGQEAAIDVPQLNSTILDEGPTKIAPIAVPEEVMIQDKAKNVSSTPIIKINGSVPMNTSGLDTSADISYNPNQTREDDDDDEDEAKPNLDEQIQKLEEHYEKVMIEQNSTSSPATTTTTPNVKPVVKAPPKSKCAACVKVTAKLFFYSLMFAILLLAVTFFICFYTKYQHPLLTEARKQLVFLEPVKHTIDKTIDAVVKKFK